MTTFQRDVFFATQAQYNLNADQAFRTWIQGISDGLAAVGLVQTADTGQINIATVTSTLGSGNVIRGYQIWRFSDPLQATAPVFFKIEYGSQANGNGPAIWLTVGKSSDGAGNINTVVSRRHNWGSASGQVNTSSPLLISSDGSGVVVLMTKGFQGGSPSWDMAFIIERSRNADGTPNGDGLMLCGTGVNTNQDPIYSQFMSYGASAWSATQNYWPVPFPGARIGTANAGTSQTLFPAVVVTPKAQGPSLMLLGCGINDFVVRSQVKVTISGALRNYIAMTGTNAGRAVDSSGCGFLLWWQ